MRTRRLVFRRRPVVGALSILAGLILVISPALSAPPSGAVGVWHFDEGSGLVAADSSGNGFDGAISGPEYAPGLSQTGLDFRGGTNERVIIDDAIGGELDPGNGDLTLSLWMRTSGSPSAGPPAESWELVEKRDVGGDGYELYLWNNLGGATLSWQLWDEGSPWNVSVAAPNDGGWHHIAGVVDGPDITLYVDGSPVGTTTTARVDVDPAADLVLGSDSTGAAWSDYEGDLDELRIYPRALTPEEIGDLATATAIVNSTADADDLLAGDGVCDTGATIVGGDRECTLRAALSEANASALVDAINFDIPTSDAGHDPVAGVWTFAPASVYPAISEAVVIDGHTQSGATPPTVAWPAPMDGSISLEILGGLGGNTAPIGLHLSASAVGTEIRGVAIGGFSGHGVVVDADDAVVTHVHSGVRADGTTPAANGVGITVRAGGARIGGPTAADRVVVSGNLLAGIELPSARASNVIDGTFVGLAKDGVTVVPNGDHGIEISDTETAAIGVVGNTIAGHAAGEVTLISARGARIENNLIGVAHDGTALGGNDGIQITNSSTSSVVTGNTIASLAGAGVTITSASSVDNAVVSNSIHGNGGLGIDIDAIGPLPNDSGDVDAGPNGLQNHPTITSATAIGGILTVAFELDTEAGDVAVEVYSNPDGADPSGFGEGQTLLGTRTISHGGAGPEPHQVSVSGTVGDIISLTATRLDALAAPQSTSEFSPVVVATAGTCTDTDNDGLCDFEEDANLDGDNDPSTSPGPDTDGDTTPDWLDPINTVGYDCGADQAVIPATECGALVRIFEDTNGVGWVDSTRWITSEPDRWFGVTVDGGFVTGLELPANGLIGSLPDEIANLPNLTTLDLGDNSLTGDLPDGVASMTGLEILDLGGNSFTPDVIPAWTETLTNLTVLDLSGTGRVGPIPAGLDQLTSLVELRLGDNDLDGPIPDELAALTQLVVLDLGGNDFEPGPIPSWLSDRTSIRVIDLESTSRTGTIPSVFGTFADLEALRLADNELRGPVPEELHTIPAGLTVVSLDGNNCLLAGPNALRSYLDTIDPDWQLGCGDSDGDGLWDSDEDANVDGDFDATTNRGHNTDGDANADAFDANDDGDGLLTAAENPDPNGDGSSLDALDADRDGQSDHIDLVTAPASTPIETERRIAGDTGDLASAPALGDRFGASVTPIGDLNGDGVIDLAVGAPGTDDGGINRGSVHILLMNADGSVAGQTVINDSAGGLLNTIPSQSAFGAALASPGDLDHDGTVDLIVGAPGHSVAGPERGAIYVLYLNPDGSVARDVLIADGAGLPVNLNDGDRFGSALATTRDLDGNGGPEVLVGAPGSDDGGVDKGAVHVLELRFDGRVAATTMIAESTDLPGAVADGDEFGHSVAVVGDLDGDGREDVAIGAPGADDGGPNRGAIHMISLDAAIDAVPVARISDTSGGLTTALADELRFASSLGAVGDVDRDGVPDLLVGAPDADLNGTERGGAILVLLSSNGEARGEQIIGSGFGGLLDPLDDGDRFASAIRGIGDLDGDGTLTLAVGADGDSDDAPTAGALWILDLDVASSVIVNSTADGPDDTPGDGVCDTGGTNSSGEIECTLRAALEEANASTSVETVEFEIPTNDPGYTGNHWTIRPDTPLPTIVRPVAILGETQTGSVCAADGNHTLTIYLNGGAAGAAPVLDIAAGDSLISGVAVANSPSRGIDLDSSDNQVRCAFVGIRPDLGGTPETLRGIRVNGDRNLIGGGEPGDMNIITVEGEDGVFVGGTSADTVITGNRIGTDPTGAVDLSLQGTGVRIGASAARTTIEDNLVSGNRLTAIHVQTTSTDTGVIRNNLIGPAADGTSAIRNGWDGISVHDGTGLLIGDVDPALGNTIAYNNGDGIHVTTTALGDAVILGNSIHSNNRLGIDVGVDGVTANVDGDSIVDHPTILSAEASGGLITLVVELTGEAGDRRIEGHRILVPDGSGHGEGRVPISNTTVSHPGGSQELLLLIPGSPGDVVTLTATTVDTLGDFGSTSEFSNAYTATAGTTALVNSTNDGSDLVPGDDRCDTGGTNAEGFPECTLRAALEETGAAASTLEAVEFAIPTIDSGYDSTTGVWTIDIGSTLVNTGAMSIDGSTQQGFRPNTNPALQSFNGQPVIHVDGSAMTVGSVLDVRYPVAISDLIVSDSPEFGIRLRQDAVGSSVTGSWIGLRPDGTTAGPTAWTNLGVNASDVTIGGTLPEDRNVLASGGQGVRLLSSTPTGIEIEGNLIGVDVTGVAALGHDDGGIDTNGITDVTIVDNIVGASRGVAAVLVDGSAGVTVQNNWIGIGADGQAAIPNVVGIRVVDSVKVAVTRNTIAAQTSDGVQIENSIAALSANRIGRNGLDQPAGNGGHGVLLDRSPDSTIGGLNPGAANVIGHSGEDGVSVIGGGAILGNVIADSGDLAIDWNNDGVTTNDSPDVDGVTNHPVIRTLNLSGTNATAEFDLDAPAGSYRIEFFVNSTIDPSGHGEAERFETTIDIVHPGGGEQAFTHVFTAAPGDLVSATATPLDLITGPGSTSELSATVRTNRAPVFDGAVGTRTDPESGSVDIPMPATDLDGDTLTWQAVDLPPGLSIDTATGRITGTVSPTGAAGSPYSTLVTVSDGRGGEDVDTWLWVITDVNRPPTIDPILDQTIDELTTLAFTASASDPDLPANTVTFSSADLPPGATLDPGTGAFSWTPTELHGPGSFTVTIRATDNGSPTLSDETSFTITVNEVNTDPMVSPIGPQLSGEGSTVSISPVVVDPDVPVNTLTWSAMGLPPGLAIDTTTGEISGTVDNTAGAGSPYTVVISVDDGVGGSASETVAWTITNTNQNPTIDPIDSQVVDEGDTVTFVVIARDPDLPPDNLTLSAADLPAGATFDPTTGVFEWVTSEIDGPSTTVITVTATDDGTPNLAASRPVSVTVNEVNTDPVLAAIEPAPGDGLPGGGGAGASDAFLVPEGTTFSVTPTVTDVDLPSNTMTFSALGLPDTATLDTSTGEITWTPDEAAAPSTHEVTLTVTDDANGTSSQSFTVVGTEVNADPTIGVVPDATINEFETLTVAFSAIDPDLPTQTLTFSALDLPLGAAVDPDTGEFEWTPGEGDGQSQFSITAIVSDDSGGSDETTFTVTVNEINEPPSIETTEAIETTEDDQISITLLGTDVDLPADPLAWSANGLPPGLALDPSTGVVSGRLPFDASDNSPYLVEISLADGRGGVDTVEIEWTVANKNRGPVINTVPAQTIDEGTSLRLPVIATDPDGDLLSYTLAGQPAGALIDTVTGEIRWSPGEAQGPGTFTFDVIVRDVRSDAIAAQTPVRITVREVNRRPSLAAVADGLRGAVDTLFTLGMAASDPDRPDNTLRFRLVDGPPGASVDPITGLVSWRPSDDYGNRTAAMTVEVTDNGSPARTDRRTFSIFVEVPPLAFVAPVARGDSEQVIFGQTAIFSVLNNDDGEGLRIIEVTDPANARVSIVRDGQQIAFFPDQGFSGQTTFTYTVQNADGIVSTPTSVTVFVGTPNVVANDDQFRTIENVEGIFDVLENDVFDTDVTIELGRAVNGSIEKTNDGKVRYTPDRGFVGTDQFTYTITDDFGSFQVATVTIEVSEEVLTDAAIELLEVDTPEPSEEIVPSEGSDEGSIAASPIQIGEFTSAFAGTVSSLDVPPAMVMGAGMWMILFGIAVTWFMPGGAVMVVNNVSRGNQIAVQTRGGETDERFEIRHDADMIWSTGRSRRRRGRRFRRIETPSGPGYVDEKQLVEMNEAYLESEG